MDLWVVVFYYLIASAIPFPGLTIQANMYYKMLISWTSQKIKDTYATHNAFDFKHGNSFLQYRSVYNKMN